MASRRPLADSRGLQYPPATMPPLDRPALREQVRQVRERQTRAWEQSRRLIGAGEIRETVGRLAAALREAPLASDLKQVLLGSLREGRVDRLQDLHGETLKTLTGLPTAKALRALCVLFGVVGADAQAESSALPPAEIERLVRGRPNPYEVLVAADVASVLDLGAGDLSFLDELAEQYAPRLAAHGRPLTLHGVDRLQPGSKFGGPLHASRERLQRLAAREAEGVRFRFWGGLDMFALDEQPAIWPTYTIVTCHAPATPAFAYEPRRLGPARIEQHLRETKGSWRRVRADGEEALEVLHDGKALLFPPWKFEIRGPLALLDVLARRGKLCVLGSVDNEVFWELLAQLIEDPAVRPPDVLFTPPVLAEVFGERYRRLSALPVGEVIALEELAPLRQALPRLLDSGAGASTNATYRFRYVAIRRGATFPGLPASLTARLFPSMRQEALPWMLVLVPEGLSD